MATLIDLRRRIRSVQNSQQITQAMKTVATAKFRKAHKTVLESRPYWHLQPEMMERLAFWAAEAGHPLLARRAERKIEVMIVTSDKGLAGAYNSNLLAAACAFIEERAAAAELRLVLVGKKAAHHFRRTPLPVDRIFGDKTDRLTAEDIRDLADFLMRQYVLQRIDGFTIVRNEFKSILGPKIVIQPVLPLERRAGPEGPGGWGPDWEPGEMRLLRFLLPLYIESQIRHALHESQAAEHAARMMAMDNATKNAEELIDHLVLQLNKIRQAGITKELLEIITAVEALRQQA